MSDYLLKVINYFLKFVDIKLDRLTTSSDNIGELKTTKHEEASLMTTTKFAEIINNELKIDSMPVDLDAILRKYGIELCHYDLSSINADYEVSGFIKKENNRTTIVIHSKEPPQRKRFTIAHELGHYFLHMRNSPDNMRIVELRGFRKHDLKELEADQFAAELLMPTEFVKAKHQESFLPTSLELSKSFNVSTAAMRYRLDMLGLAYYD